MDTRGVHGDSEWPEAPEVPKKPERVVQARDSNSKKKSPGVSAPLRLVCPTCGGNAFDGVHSELESNFFCEHCAACWNQASGTLRRVNPGTCEGCEHFSRCILAYAKDANHSDEPPRSAYSDHGVHEGDDL